MAEAFSLCAYAASLRRSLLEGQELKSLLELDKLHSQILDNIGKISVASRADYFALCFIAHVNVNSSRFLIKNSRMQDAFPWKRACDEFLARVGACNTHEKLEVMTRDFLGSLPPWFPNPPRGLMFGGQRLQLIAKLDWLLKPNNLVRLHQNCRILQELSGMSATYRYVVQSHAWKFKFNQLRKDVRIDAGLALLPPEATRQIPGLVAQSKPLKELYLIPEYKNLLKYMQQFKQHYEDSSEGVFTNLGQTVAEIQDEFFPEFTDPTPSSWGQRYSTHLLASYRPSSNLVSMSLIFDLPGIPADIMRYIIYHELLHRKLSITRINGRHYCHTPEFRQRERQFPNSARLEKEISALISQPAKYLDFNRKLQRPAIKNG